MAELAGLSYRKLAWCATWYLREDTLKAALAQVVNFQHRQLLAQAWGSGTPVVLRRTALPSDRQARHSTASPRY
jgi:TnpA family transposase